jgi:hypothetical protein
MAPACLERASSTIEFHSPQFGHCPAQRGASPPQAEQTYVEELRATGA